MTTGCLALLLCCAASVRAEPGTSTDSPLFALVDGLAGQLVASDRYLGRARLTLPADHILHCDFGPDHASLVAPHDVAIRSVDALIRVKALRRDFASVFPKAAFWTEPLDRIYAAVQLLDSQSSDTNDQAFTDALGAEAAHERDGAIAELERRFQDLEARTMQAAASGKIDVEAARDRPAGFKVVVHVSPPKARVRCMPLLTYLRCTKLPGHSLDIEWMDLADGSTNSLIGKYWYRAEWPPELSRTLEGTFEIGEDKTLTFFPQAGK